jgi:hypothetical protein
VGTWVVSCPDNRLGWLPDIPCPAYPEPVPLERAVASGNIAEGSEVLPVAVGYEETGGDAAAAADDAQGEMGFVAELQTSVDRTETFQRPGGPRRATGTAVAAEVAVPKPAVAAVNIRMERPDPYHHPWMGWIAAA